MQKIVRYEIFKNVCNLIYSQVDIIYEFDLKSNNKISYLEEYTNFLKENKIYDEKINNWIITNLTSNSNNILEKLNKKVKFILLINLIDLSKH